MTKTKDELLALAERLGHVAEMHGDPQITEAAALIRSMAEAGVEKCLKLADDYSDACYIEGRDGRPAVESNEARAALETALRSLAVQQKGLTPAELHGHKPDPLPGMRPREFMPFMQEKPHG